MPTVMIESFWVRLGRIFLFCKRWLYTLTNRHTRHTIRHVTTSRQQEQGKLGTAHCRQLLCSAGNNLWKKTMQQRARRPLICRHSKIERSRMRLSLWGWGPILPRVRGAKVKAPRPSAGWRHQLGCCSQPPQPPPLQRWWVGTIYTHRGTQPVFRPHSDTRQSPPPHSTLICFPVPKTHAGCLSLGSDYIIMFL